MRPVVLLSLIALLAACDAEGPEAVGPLGDVVVEFDPFRPALTVRTVEHYPCLGYRVEMETDREGDVFEIALGEVLPPAGDVCLTAEGPAEATVDLPQNFGMVLPVFLTKEAQTDEYEVRVGFAGYGIRAIRTSFSALAE